MRITIPTVILSLVAATSVYAAPAAPVHMDKRDWVMDQLKPVFEKALKTLEYVFHCRKKDDRESVEYGLINLSFSASP